MGGRGDGRELLCTGILRGRGWGALQAFRALRAFIAFDTFKSIVDNPTQFGVILEWRRVVLLGSAE